MSSAICFNFGQSKILSSGTGLKGQENQRTEGPESRTDGETLIFWDR